MIAIIIGVTILSGVLLLGHWNGTKKIMEEGTPPSSPRSKAPITVVGVIFIVLALWAGIHVFNALTSKNSPPAACQLLGGQWDIWNGWRCG